MKEKILKNKEQNITETKINPTNTFVGVDAVVIILRGQIESLTDNYGIFVYKEGNNYKELTIPKRFLNKISSDYKGAQIDIKIIKSKRKPLWAKPNKALEKLMKKLSAKL